MDRRDEAEFGGTGCLYDLLTFWLPFTVLCAVAAVLRVSGLPGDLIVFGAVALLLVWLTVRRHRRL